MEKAASAGSCPRAGGFLIHFFAQSVRLLVIGGHSLTCDIKLTGT